MLFLHEGKGGFGRGKRDDFRGKIAKIVLIHHQLIFKCGPGNIKQPKSF